MSVRVAGTAAQDWADTHHSPLPTPTFHLVEAQTSSIQDLYCSPFTFASKACLGSLSWGILLTWPNHL